MVGADARRSGSAPASIAVAQVHVRATARQEQGQVLANARGGARDHHCAAAAAVGCSEARQAGSDEGLLCSLQAASQKGRKQQGQQELTRGSKDGSLQGEQCWVLRARGAGSCRWHAGTARVQPEWKYPHTFNYIQ